MLILIPDWLPAPRSAYMVSQLGAKTPLPTAPTMCFKDAYEVRLEKN